MDLRLRLADEFELRWSRNPRYSLRAFARDIGVHHTTITRVLDRSRRLTPVTARRIGTTLKMTDAEIAAALVTANAEWLARCIRHRRFAPDTRALAVLTGMSIDDVNVALNHLLHRRELTMRSATSWELKSA